MDKFKTIQNRPEWLHEAIEAFNDKNHHPIKKPIPRPPMKPKRKERDFSLEPDERFIPQDDLF